MKMLGIKTYDKDDDHLIAIMTTPDLTALEMLHLLDELLDELADIYKLPVQYLTGMLHAAFGGDLLTEPTEEQRLAIDNLTDQIKKELSPMLEDYIDE